MNDERIQLAHGHGGQLSLDLIEQVILPALGATGAPTMDAAPLPRPRGQLVMSTDSFTVSPLFFPGGDIGKLAACGTLNDVAMLGAEPLALSLALILEEGLPLDDLRRIMESFGRTVAACGVPVITGDTKVVERGKGDGVFINTTGIGVRRAPQPIGPARLRKGDVLLISGTVGDHGVAILNARNNLAPGLKLESDCAVLWPLVAELIEAIGGHLHALRDPTRGGLAATLNEFARDTGLEIILREGDIPVRDDAAQVLDILGMDPLIMANEGKLMAFVSPREAGTALAALRAHPLGANAAIIGEVTGPGARVVLETPYGTRRIVEMPVEEGLPRIC